MNYHDFFEMLYIKSVVFVNKADGLMVPLSQSEDSFYALEVTIDSVFRSL